ncbi:helix-turn-helix transcriptional regulator [Bacillus thuringiensis]|uniref:helix-turn-helix transcriptional regulator n=1 Tax=Bacillus thuringiensis TaxID=1428 RepID=UPI0023EE779D|nr:helix-turn-helix transcriptional regulator [Bacillus thuringiensis]
MRIHHATNMLLETDFSISEIAQLNGYDDPNYFIKIFKQQLGITPNRYRKN